MLSKKSMYQMMDECHIPGVVIGICKKNQILDILSLGYSSYERMSEMSQETVFPLGSCVKSFTSLALAKLVDEEKVKWNDLAKSVICGFKLNNKELEDRLTLEDLLTHQSGISKNSLLWDFRPMTRKELLELLPELECFPQNKGIYVYNNIAYTLLEKLIEDIGDSPYEKAINNLLLEPACMHETYCDYNRFIQNPQSVHSFVCIGEDLVECSLNNLNQNEVVGTTIYSNIKDVLKWLQLYLNKGNINGKQLVSYCNMAKTITPHVDVIARNLFSFTPQSKTGYCMGWMATQYCDKKVVYHEGRSFGCNATLAFLPENDLGIAILSNREHNTFSMKMLERIIEDYFENNGYKLINDTQKKYFYIQKFVNKVYGTVTLIENQEGKIFLNYYSLKTKVSIQDNKLICVPDKAIFSMRNKLGKNGSLVFDYEKNSNGNYCKLILNNEPEVKNIEFLKA